MSLHLFDLSGRIALVTGAAQGIGRALVEGLALAGAHVVLNGRDEAKLAAAADELCSRSLRVSHSVFDVTDHAAVAERVAPIESTIGSLDILVNNAGIQRRAPLEEFSVETWHELMRTNLDSVFYVSRAVARYMVPRRRGKIINIASLQSEAARYSIAPYTATKGAVKNLTRGMCTDWARYGLQINGVGFGKVDLEEARRRDYRVSNTTDVLTDDVADLAIGLIIGLLRQVAAGHSYIRRWLWPRAEPSLSSKVSGRRNGIYGLGRIGTAVAKRVAFDASIADCSRTGRGVPYTFYGIPGELAANRDVLVVTVGASDRTQNAINADVLDALGPDGFLVNVGRGSVVDEPALVRAPGGADRGGCAGCVRQRAGCSQRAVRSVERPHDAAHRTATRETRRVMADLVLANLDAHFSDRPIPTAVV